VGRGVGVVGPPHLGLEAVAVQRADVLGGEDGVPHDYRLISADRAPRVLRTKEVGIEIRPNDCLEVRSSGGGGWGPPARRSPQARQRDREQGLTRDIATTGQDSR